jgi:hypothetical protein
VIGTIGSNLRYSASGRAESDVAVSALLKALAQDQRYKNWYLWALAQFGRKAAQALPVIETMQLTNTAFDNHALETLVEIGRGTRAREIVMTLTNGLSDSNAVVQMLCIRYIGIAKDDGRDAIPILVHLIGDHRPEIQKAALRSLALVGPPRSIISTLKTLAREDTAMAPEAAVALLRLNPDDNFSKEVVRRYLRPQPFREASERHSLVELLLDIPGLSALFESEIDILSRDNDTLISAMIRQTMTAKKE